MAWPVPFSVPVSSVVAPSLKVTVPVGTPAPEVGVTFAVNVTLEPAEMDVDEALIAVDVAPSAVLTTRLTALEVDEASLLSPLYAAVTEYVEAAREDVVNTALPLAPSETAESCVLPFRNVTVPVGAALPEAGATVAVNVTVCPAVAGLGAIVKAVVVATGLMVRLTAEDVLDE